MLRIQPRALALGTLLFLGSVAPAMSADLVVSAGEGVLQKGVAVPVIVSLPELRTAQGVTRRKLPSNSTDVTTFYQVCTSRDEKASWKTGLGWEVFCSLKDQQAKITQSNAEAAPELVTGGEHKFAQTFVLPQNPVGTRLWTLVRVDYRTPDQQQTVLHHSLYGSAILLFRCEGKGGKGNVRNCAYFTPSAWSIYKKGNKLPFPKP